MQGSSTGINLRGIGTRMSSKSESYSAKNALAYPHNNTDQQIIDYGSVYKFYLLIVAL